MTSPSDGPIYLSYSTAKIIATKSPAHAWLDHKRLGGRRKPANAAQIKGTAIHALLLGAEADPGIQLVAIDGVPVQDYRKKAAQEQRDAILESGATPLTEPQMRELLDAAESIKVNLRAQGIALDGKSEVGFKWESQSARGPVACRARIDHVKPRATYDLKSIHDAHPDACARQALQMGYDIQWAAYSEARVAADPSLAGRLDFLFIFFETEPPYSVTPLRPDGMFREHGERRWKKAVEVWAECLESNVWPHYVDGVGSISVPPWALAKMDGDYEREIL